MIRKFDHITFSDTYGWVISYKGEWFYSVYQSIHRPTGQTYGYEALLRQVTPASNKTHTSAFTNLSSQERDTLELCSLLIHLRNFPRYSRCKLFVNASPKTLVTIAENQDILDFFCEMMEANCLRTEQVCIEVTEQEFCGDLSKACDVCRDFGFEIAIDDYGDGGSTVERARQVKPSVLKVSGNLLTKYMQSERDELISAIKVAQELKSIVIVEGVDSLDKLLAMKKHNVDLLQGFYLGYPRDLITQRELQHSVY